MWTYEDIHSQPTVHCLHLTINCLKVRPRKIETDRGTFVPLIESVVNRLLITLAKNAHSRGCEDVERDAMQSTGIGPNTYSFSDWMYFSAPWIKR